MLKRILGIGNGACLVIGIVAMGLFACIMPLSTSVLSNTFSDEAHSFYDKDSLVLLAKETRNFTVDAPENSDYTAASNSLNEVIAAELNATHFARAATDSATGNVKNVNRLEHILTKLGLSTSEDVSADQVVSIADISDLYGLDSSAFSHLIDCNKLINAAIPWLILAIAACVALTVLFAVKKWLLTLGRSLFYAPLVLVALLLIAGLWAAFDFNGFFTLFHSVLFPQGNWIFSANSLLICMYPTEFWMGMGGIWLITSLAISLICIIIGRQLIRKLHDSE